MIFLSVAARGETFSQGSEPGVFTVNATGTIDSRYAVVNIETDNSTAQRPGEGGKVTGEAKPYVPATYPDPVTFNLNLQGALVGARPNYVERCMVLRLGFQGGKLTSGLYGKINPKSVIYDLTGFPADAGAVTFNGDCIRGKLTIRAMTLDLVPCVYTFGIDGRIVGDLVSGAYTMAAKPEGDGTITRSGSFDGTWSAGIQFADELDTRPWWIPVEGFKTVQAGEHPRLLFRESDLPALRKKAETPEGKAMIARLRYLLNGSDGETMPTKYSNAVKAYDNDAENDLPAGTYTFSHAAGYGMLYQLTGDKKYAEFGRLCFELAFQGQRDRDDRYSWVAPGGDPASDTVRSPVEKNKGGALRAGPTLGWYSLGYDLCYDGWNDTTREKIAKAIENYRGNYKEGQVLNFPDLETLARGDRAPGSNHFGMQTGGGAMALMAIMNDPGVNRERIASLLKISEKSMIRNVTEGFGDGGFFAEGDGTGSMSSHIIYLAAIKAWREAMGMDFVNVERPNVRMTALKWIYLTVFRDGKPDFWPIRGAYGPNVWGGGLSGGGYFSIGFGAVTEEQKEIMKWYYNRHIRENDMKAGTPYETESIYPHHMVCALVNWPLDIPERNPAEILPLCYRDSIYSFYAWRNRWQDENDIVITVLTKTTTAGSYVSYADTALQVAAFGRKFSWGKINGDVKSWQSSPHGEASVLTMHDGTSVAVDFTKASGADGLLVTTGRADGCKVKLGTTVLTFKFLTEGKEPAVRVRAGKVKAGKQTVTLKDGSIVLGLTKSD